VSDSRQPVVAILGSGVAGLCMGIQLKRAGVETFTIYEKSDRLGGTWRDNGYPGAACDVPSHLYSFSFEPNPSWSRKFSPQPEIQAYLERCADTYDVRRHVRFGVEIASARYDEAQEHWTLGTVGGETITADVVVSGTGQLNRPHMPDIPGLDEFAGTWFHSARWRPEHRFEGERVVVIGNGASAVQFVPPVAAQAAHLTVLQRSANWLIPRMDRAYTPREQWVFRNVPLVERLYRWLIYWLLEVRFFGFREGTFLARKLTEVALQYLDEQIPDPALREVLTPDYPVGCKRILISDDYYEALRRPNVDVVTTPIARIARDGVVLQDGTTVPADTILFATGFEATSFLAPMTIEGIGGRALHDAWRDGAEAYLGVAVADFPNLFLLYGPNTNLGHNSIIFMIECQVDYVVRCIQTMMRRRVSRFAVRRDVMSRYNETLQRVLAQTTWTASCGSWYKTASGKVTNNWSGFTVEYWWRMRRPDLDAFDLTASASSPRP
jgi:cation diffusion facilitator CzcD-associated flavoprotein CzcO